MEIRRWIAITDEVPSGVVIGYDCFYGHISVCELDGTDDNGRPFLKFLDAQQDDCRITHWMPLPVPPKYKKVKRIFDALEASDG